MFKADDPSHVRTEVRKRLKDEMLRVVLAALDLGAPARLTTSGIIIAGRDDGSVAAHWTSSDHRAVRNLESSLRRLGYDMPRVNKSSRQQETKKPPRKPKRDTFRPLPRLYEPDTRPKTVTWRPDVPEPEPLPVPVHEPKTRRAPGARASALSSRVIHPRIAAMYAQLPDSLREARPELLLAALNRADNDPRRITADADGSLLVWNRPAW